jgi:hypothetical protein
MSILGKCKFLKLHRMARACAEQSRALRNRAAINITFQFTV